MITKRRIVTIVLTLSLCAITVVLEVFWRCTSLLHHTPLFAQWMLISTAIFVFFGCMLQSLGHPRWSVVLGDLVFVILCVCVFYSKEATDILMFVLCMWLLLRRSAHACECVREQMCSKPDK